jgi:hypothetical protein
VKTRNAGISRNMPEYHDIFPEYNYRNITIFSDGSHATTYKHGRLTTYFITKVMDLFHFDKVTNNNSILEVLYVVYIIIIRVTAS